MEQVIGAGIECCLVRCRAKEGCEVCAMRIRNERGSPLSDVHALLSKLYAVSRLYVPTIRHATHHRRTRADKVGIIVVTMMGTPVV